jgi:hypothetical protein
MIYHKVSSRKIVKLGSSKIRELLEDTAKLMIYSWAKSPDIPDRSKMLIKDVQFSKHS